MGALAAPLARKVSLAPPAALGIPGVGVIELPPGMEIKQTIDRGSGVTVYVVTYAGDAWAVGG